MAPRFRSDKANRQRLATVVRAGEAVGRHPILVGALLTVAVLALFTVESLPSAPALPVKSASSAPAPLYVSAGARLVAVDPVLTAAAATPARHARASTSAIASRVRLSGAGKRRDRLSLTLGEGKNNAQIRAITVRLPRGMAFSHADKQIAAQIVVKADGMRLKLTERIGRRTLTIRLKATALTVHVTINGPSITLTKALAHRIKLRELKVVHIRITTTDANHRITRLIVRQPAR